MSLSLESIKHLVNTKQIGRVGIHEWVDAIVTETKLLCGPGFRVFHHDTQVLRKTLDAGSTGVDQKISTLMNLISNHHMAFRNLTHRNPIQCEKVKLELSKLKAYATLLGQELDSAKLAADAVMDGDEKHSKRPAPDGDTRPKKCTIMDDEMVLHAKFDRAKTAVMRLYDAKIHNDEAAVDVMKEHVNDVVRQIVVFGKSRCNNVTTKKKSASMSDGPSMSALARQVAFSSTISSVMFKAFAAAKENRLKPRSEARADVAPREIMRHAWDDATSMIVEMMKGECTLQFMNTFAALLMQLYTIRISAARYAGTLGHEDDPLSGLARKMEDIYSIGQW